MKDDGSWESYSKPTSTGIVFDGDCLYIPPPKGKRYTYGKWLRIEELLEKAGIQREWIKNLDFSQSPLKQVSRSTSETSQLKEPEQNENCNFPATCPTCQVVKGILKIKNINDKSKIEMSLAILNTLTPPSP